MKSAWSVAGPPEQWPTPGTGYSRAKSSARLPLERSMPRYQVMASSIEKIGSLAPW
jgi:hypothetical protein